ncbi:polysaccharide deacetylase family protein [Candidatus Thiodiazotropha sp. CDECU1]|uniref:polysaccharide deacetylase family protein n=1 Tax=Candidatus Thiodiazotropha sp. CDECU1 TaxID=3065865 RepID=UPI00292F307D|nr:polysaccharide deacetylase family protein [Candidatus Thiodiazotropha sp. CDECU1]
MVDPANFDMHLSIVTKLFTIEDTKGIADILNNNAKISEPKCIITFDDGWSDNYEYAFPLLQKYHCPALIFVPVNYISSTSTFWQERLGFLIWKSTEINTVDSRITLKKYGMDKLDEKNKQSSIMNYVRSLKSLSYREIDTIMSDFSQMISLDEVSSVDKHMSWEELVELNSNNIQIGSHACSHKILTQLDSKEIYEELKQSKTIIEDKLRIKVKDIAYPNGNYNKEIGEIAKKTGYELGFGTTFGHVDSSVDKYNLKRININDDIADSKPMFLATILGIF